MDTPDRGVFDEIYATAQPEQIAWHYDEPPAELVAWLDTSQLAPCKAIELGCGLGSQCVALARRGFEVTGVDCSRAAITQARARAAQAGVTVDFRVADVLDSSASLQSPYGFAWDWEVLHHIFPAQRAQFVRSVAELLAPQGRYLSVAFSEQDPWLADQGKYRTTPIQTVLYFSSEQELREQFEPWFRVVDLRTIEIRGKHAPHLANWLLVEKR